MNTILLVEDDDTSRQALGRALERAGYRCLLASSAQQALARLDEGPLSAAVIDIVLGSDDRGGLGLVRPVRASAGNPLVVMITAFADVERVKQALNSGASYLIEKPFRAPELVDVLSRLLAERSAPSPPDEIDVVGAALAQANLTEKEAVVARLVLKGLRSHEIARIENNSEKTIRHHITQIYAKCRVSSRAELFHFVFPS